MSESDNHFIDNNIYYPSTSTETSPMSNEDIIAQKILKRVEIAKMTRQLKDKLFKAGLKVRDQNGNNNNNDNDLDNNTNNTTNNTNSNSNSDSNFNSITNINNEQSNFLFYSNNSSPVSSPSKSLSEDVTNNITATAISNIQNSKLLTPTRNNRLSFENSNLSFTAITPLISPLKRKNSSIYRSTTFSRNLLYDNNYDDELASPVKRINTSNFQLNNNINNNNNNNNISPYSNGNSTSPYQLNRGFSIPTPTSQSINNQSHQHHHQHNTHLRSKKINQRSNNPKTPPTETIDIFRENTNLTMNKSKQEINIININNHSTYSNNAPLQSQLLSTPKSSTIKTRDFSTPNKNGNNSDDMGADLLLYLSNSPARNYHTNSVLNKQNIENIEHESEHEIEHDNDNENDKLTNGTSVSKIKNSKERIINIPTTPKHISSNNTINLNIESTPLRNQLPSQFFLSPNNNNNNNNNINSFMQPLLGTPIGINNKSLNNNNNKNLINRTPGFSMSDYINFTPSPRISRTPVDYNHIMYSKPVINYSKELNSITNTVREDEE
ncbi:hypothetical protein DAPK24_011510 [Pichia kluyveri]|uniref:Uncharacterized protein n=1 Tax=Pichia kluyveri TaxID=36015 RepID=A0AAV5R1S4_PICKL|nr:hypothetical protein DAPK24_011510 [Pichia kluyveri]